MSANRSKKYKESDQLCFENISLQIGDKLYKDGQLYGELSGESETLFFMKRPGKLDEIPSPYLKNQLIERVIMGTLTVQSVRFV